jgi:hypothetical protein
LSRPLSRLLYTDLRPGTANNDINAIQVTQGGVPGGYVVWNYLTSAFPGSCCPTRRACCSGTVCRTSDMSVEFSTDNLLVKGRQRYVFDYDDWRALYMSNPTS